MATGFRVLGDSDDKGLKKVTVSSFTGAINDLLELIAGSTTWTAVASGSNHFTRKGILQETAVAASSVLILELNGTEKVEAQSNATADTADNGDLMLATDTNTVNNTGANSGSQNAIFIQDGTGRDTTTIVGRVIVGNGIDPDAS